MAVTDVASVVPGFVLSFVVVTVGSYVGTAVLGEDADPGCSAVTAAITFPARRPNAVAWVGLCSSRSVRAASVARP